LASSALCFSATAADKMVIAHRGASGICRNIPCRRKRWLTLRGRITLSKTW
jgi:glycerophosphoryl diester phosphodiesterase